ncbi:MAG: contractile injection system tape measure protein [Cyanobacteria bacterium]|nr:contractile injection system tape measure protein [Cyanobacteriota bacterium]
MNFVEGGAGDDSPAPPSHRLHRLELEISTAEEPFARSLMDRLSQLHHAALESLLEQVFSELSPPGRRDRLEHLELDLGTLQASDLEQQLPQRLEAALRRALAARLPPPQAQPLPPPLQPQVPPKRHQPPSATDPPETSTAPAGPAADADRLQRQLELLAMFTATGSLPWWAPRDDRQLIPSALDNALALPPPELRALLQQLAGPPGEPSVALQRLLAAASPQQRPRIEQALQEAAPEAELQAQLFAANNFDAPDEPPTNAEASPTTTAPPEAPGEPDPNPPNPSALAHLAIYASTGRWPPGEGLGPNPPQALEAALDSALALPSPELRALLQQLAGAPGADSVAAQRLLAAASPQQRSRLEAALQAEELEVALQGEAAMKAAQVEALDAALQKALKPTEPAASDPTATARLTTPPTPQSRSDVDDDLVIDGAGMVLLWPFLETLFSRLELLTQERLFGDEAQRQRAMALLGFLVDGDGDPPEWRLTLAKLLCGALPQAPYGLEAPLSDAEQAEAEALLQALLDHADGRLGDDGAALRQGFLQRPGLLSARPGAWVLQVERCSGDEVLDGLPWSWSWIRLPWMDDLLQVVW